MDRPSDRRFVVVGAGSPCSCSFARRISALLPLAVVAPLVAYVAWRRRFSLAAVCVVAAVLPLAAWAVHNGLRYDDCDRRARRACLGAVPPGLQRKQSISADNGAASERLAELIESEVLSGSRTRLGCHARRLSAERLELRDGAADRALRLGPRQRRELRGAVRLRARGDPRTPRYLSPRRHRSSGSSCARSRCARTSRPASRPRPGPAADVRVERKRASEPAGERTRRRGAVRLRLVRPTNRLVHARRSVSGLYGSRDARSGIARWSRRYEPGTRGCVSGGGERRSRAPQPHHFPGYPTPVLWLGVGVVALFLRRPRGWRTIVLLWVAASLVLLIHAASRVSRPSSRCPCTRCS